jgi:alkylhydroperoxidase family enzyme
VDEALMERMRSQFTEEQIVELGYFVSLTFGQQRWIKTLGIGLGEVTVATVTDPKFGTSWPGTGQGATVNANDFTHAGDTIRKRAPHVLKVYEETRNTVLESGVVERELKELCARYLAVDDEVVAHATNAELYDARQRAALAWANAIAWDSDRADDALWRRLHSEFTEPELVELGYTIAITLGQQHWLATHGVIEQARARPVGVQRPRGRER